MRGLLWRQHHLLSRPFLLWAAGDFKGRRRTVASMLEATATLRSLDAALADWKFGCICDQRVSAVAYSIQQKANWRVRSARMVLGAKMLTTAVNSYVTAQSKGRLQQWEDGFRKSAAFRMQFLKWELKRSGPLTECCLVSVGPECWWVQVLGRV